MTCCLCHSTVSGNANLVAHRILEKIPQQDTYVLLLLENCLMLASIAELYVLCLPAGEYHTHKNDIFSTSLLKMGSLLCAWQMRCAKHLFLWSNFFVTSTLQVWDVCGSQAFERRIPFAFLEDIKQKFWATYGPAAQNAIAYEYNSEFR